MRHPLPLRACAFFLDFDQPPTLKRRSPNPARHTIFEHTRSTACHCPAFLVHVYAYRVHSTRRRVGLIARTAKHRQKSFHPMPFPLVRMATHVYVHEKARHVYTAATIKIILAFSLQQHLLPTPLLTSDPIYSSLPFSPPPIPSPRCTYKKQGEGRDG